MKFWDWTFWRFAKEAHYNPGWKTDGVKTNKGKWVPFFRGYYFRIDSVDYSKEENRNE